MVASKLTDLRINSDFKDFESSFFVVSFLEKQWVTELVVANNTVIKEKKIRDLLNMFFNLSIRK